MVTEQRFPRAISPMGREKVLAGAARCACGACPVAAAGQIEAQAAGQRRGFRKPHTDDVAQTIDRAGALADQRLALLVMAEKFRAQRADRQAGLRRRFPSAARTGRNG